MKKNNIKNFYYIPSKIIRTAILALFYLFVLPLLHAQKLNYEISDNPGKMFELQNYQRAKELYRDIYKKDLTNTKIKYRFGVCLVYTYDRDDAIKILKDVSLKPSTPIEVWFHLARAYHLTNRYDKAIINYNKYLNLSGAKTDLIKEAKRNIEMCNNAKELIKSPLNIDFVNLGKRVNSSGKDYLPLIVPQENLILFTTRRMGTTGRIYDLEGYFTSDIYTAKYKYGKWSKARSIGAPNSYGNEQTAGISEDGKSVLYHVNNPTSKNNLQIAVKGKSSFRKSESITSKNININISEEFSATVSNSRDFIIFSSNKVNGIGNQDLYISKKLPNGDWGEAINMGEIINTQYNESYPYLKDNGLTLYFSSDGHNSMGGYDLFKSTFDLSTKKWSKPINLGYPLNTPEDNFNITFSENNKFAYVSAYRNDSEGDLDIYRVNFKDAAPSYSTIKGLVLNTDSSMIEHPITIEVFEAKTKQLYGIYAVNALLGNYIMILPPNKYEIQIDIPGKGYFKKILIVAERNKYRKELNQNIIVTFDEIENPK
jgi:tetratricopeptide (TPR) repeat protein